jgi:hypothetical protein
MHALSLYFFLSPFSLCDTHTGKHRRRRARARAHTHTHVHVYVHINKEAYSHTSTRILNTRKQACKCTSVKCDLFGVVDYPCSHVSELALQLLLLDCELSERPPQPRQENACAPHKLTHFSVLIADLRSREPEPCRDMACTSTRDGHCLRTANYRLRGTGIKFPGHMHAHAFVS